METILECSSQDAFVADLSNSFSSGTTQESTSFSSRTSKESTSFSSTSSGASGLLLGEIESGASSQSSPPRCLRKQHAGLQASQIPLDHLVRLPSSGFSPQQNTAQQGNRPSLYALPAHPACVSSSRERPASRTDRIPSPPVSPTPVSVSFPNNGDALIHPVFLPSSVYYPEKRTAYPSNRAARLEPIPDSHSSHRSSSQENTPRQSSQNSHHRASPTVVLPTPKKVTAEQSLPHLPVYLPSTVYSPDDTGVQRSKRRPRLQPVLLSSSVFVPNAPKGGDQSLSYSPTSNPTAPVSSVKNCTARPAIVSPLQHPELRSASLFSNKRTTASNTTVPSSQQTIYLPACVFVPESSTAHPINEASSPQRTNHLPAHVYPLKKSTVHPSERTTPSQQAVYSLAPVFTPSVLTAHPSTRARPHRPILPPISTSFQQECKPRWHLQQPLHHINDNSTPSRTPEVPNVFPCKAFTKLWLEPDCRENILSHLPNPSKSFADLRGLCKDFNNSITPVIFGSRTIVFKASTFKASRLNSLPHIGKLVKTLTLIIPHTYETSLKPIINAAGEEVKWDWDPEQYLESPPRGPKYGNDEVLSDLLIRQHDPIFHAACQVDKFIKFFSLLPNLETLIVTCPAHGAQKKWEDNRRSAVDYALSSLQLALEKNDLKRLVNLTLKDVHAPGVAYLSPAVGCGAGMDAARFGMRLRSLTILMRSPFRKHGRNGKDRAMKAYISLVKRYIRTFPNLKKLDFEWVGERGMCPFPVEVPRLDPDEEEPFRLRHLTDLRLGNVWAPMEHIRKIVEMHLNRIKTFEFLTLRTMSGSLDDALEPVYELARRLEEDRRNDPWASRDTLSSTVGEVPIMLSPAAPPGAPLPKIRHSHLVRADSVLSLPEPMKAPAPVPPTTPAKPRRVLYGEIMPAPIPPGPPGSAWKESVAAAKREADRAAERAKYRPGPKCPIKMVLPPPNQRASPDPMRNYFAEVDMKRRAKQARLDKAARKEALRKMPPVAYDPTGPVMPVPSDIIPMSMAAIVAGRIIDEEREKRLLGQMQAIQAQKKRVRLATQLRLLWTDTQEKMGLRKPPERYECWADMPPEAKRRWEEQESRKYRLPDTSVTVDRR